MPWLPEIDHAVSCCQGCIPIFLRDEAHSTLLGGTGLEQGVSVAMATGATLGGGAAG